MKRGVIIQASSRSYGDTQKVVSALQNLTGFDVIDLNTKTIHHFDYKFKNQDDDFKTLFSEITKNYNTLVFATPIYWYTMSGLLKVFFDRISDVLNHDKHLGRRLRNKCMAVVSCSNTNEVFDGFEMPFVKSADYLGMTYLGHLHTWVINNRIPEDVQSAITNFSEKQLVTHV